MFSLGTTLESLNPVLTALSVYHSAYFKSSPPDSFNVDDKKKKFTEEWIKEYAGNCKRSVDLFWGEWGEKNLSYNKDRPLSFSIDSFWNKPEEIIDFFREIPWTVATFSSIHRSWFSHQDGYSSPGFAYRHASLGWGCAFKGEGHQRVVSRRYLDYGPWHVIRDETNDITLIQFHDLNVDSPTAIEQAKTGHKLMGDPYEGGFIQRDYTILNPDFSGLYSPTDKMLRFIINERPITRAELLDACATRLWQLLGEDKPIERIGYVFIQESEARQNLHELWLREIECWTYLDGVETRIDKDYNPPPPEKPEWVRQLEA
jgi:hypothetical protein